MKIRVSFLVLFLLSVSSAHAAFLKKCFKLLGGLSSDRRHLEDMRGDITKIPIDAMKRLMERNGFVVETILPIGTGTFADVAHVTYHTISKSGVASPTQTAALKVGGGAFRREKERPVARVSIAHSFNMQSLAQNVEGVNVPRVIAPLWEKKIFKHRLQGYLSEFAPGEQMRTFLARFPHREEEVKKLVSDGNQKLETAGLVDMDAKAGQGPEENVLVSEIDGKLQVFFIDFGFFLFKQDGVVR